jgi:ribosomal protein S27AE
MDGTTPMRIKGGCPKCGNPAIYVSERYRADTVINCGKCGYTAAWEKFFSENKESKIETSGHSS